MKEKRKEQDFWEIGAYVRAALHTSVVVTSLADKQNIRQIKDYPEMPFKDDFETEEMTEERINAERLRAYVFFQNMARDYKSKQ